MAVVLLLSVAPLPAQEPSLSAREIQRLVQNAKSREEFKTLSAYYKLKGEAFRVLAKEQKSELDRELAHPTSTKSPSGADRARQQFQFYTSKADLAFALSAEYGRRAAQASGGERR